MLLPAVAYTGMQVRLVVLQVSTVYAATHCTSSHSTHFSSLLLEASNYRLSLACPMDKSSMLFLISMSAVMIGELLVVAWNRNLDGN